MNNSQYTTQNNLLLNTLLKFYNKDDNLSKILSIINGHAKESLRLIDWFVTNYAKKNFLVILYKSCGTQKSNVQSKMNYVQLMQLLLQF